MMKKIMKLRMHLILFAAFTSAYANPELIPNLCVTSTTTICITMVDCDFEKDSCSWSIEGFRRISDNQFNSTDGLNDSMHRNGSDWYLLFEATNDSYATLTSIQTTIEGLQCLNFWYIFSGSKQSHIQVFVQGKGRDNASATWETSMTGTSWRRDFVEIDIHYSSIVTILIQGRTGGSYTRIGIDDIVLKLASCLDCNFLDGLCSWEGKEWSVLTQSTTTFRASPFTVIPTNSNKDTMTQKITTPNRITTIVKLSSTEISTSTAAGTVNTSSYYVNDGVIIGIVIGGLAFTVAVLLIATYLYRRRATSPNANISEHSTVSSVTYSGATRPKTDNAETSHSTERLNQTSETVPYNAQAEYSTVLKTQPRQSKTQQRFNTGIVNIYPCQVQLLKDVNNVTNPEQTHNQYHQSADKDGTNSYDTVHNTDNHTTEFRDDTYDCTTIYPTKIPDPTYDHSNFKQNVNNIYDHSKSGTVNKDMEYMDHSCDTTLQRSMQDVDPTYDHT